MQEPIMSTSDYTATLAALQTQVRGLEGDYTELKSVVLGLDRKLETSFNSLNSRFETAVSGLNNKLDDRNRTPWAVIWTGLGVLITFFGLVGTLVFMPIRDNQLELKVIVADIAKSMVETVKQLPDKYANQRQLDVVIDRETKDAETVFRLQDDVRKNYVDYREHARLIKQMEDYDQNIKHAMVTRAEHEQHWKSIDDREHELQRQLDEIKHAEGATWGIRDEVQRLQRELDEHRRLLGMPTGSYRQEPSRN
jgi:hypothetical protein